MSTEDKHAKTTEVKAPEFITESIKAYGRETLEERAIPTDVDGMKPVQRRILHALNELGSKPNSNFLKCARVVGDAMGKYHPHGDASLYETLVKMVNARYPMIDGHGNFGTPTGEPAAASRYTECRISKLGADVVADLSVIPTQPNYDNTTTEPLILPARIPVLLANGSQGIAVGVQCNIPPHNLDELLSACIRLVRRPKTKVKRLLKYIKGPDYRDGGTLMSSKKDLLELYKEGRGRLTFQCEYKIEDAKDHKMLVVTSLAPYFSVERFLEKVNVLVKDGMVEYTNDESNDKRGIRLVVGFRNPQPINDLVLPMTVTTVPYDFYALEQAWVNEETGEVVKGGGKKIFHHYTFKGILLSFLRQRRHVERLLLQEELERINGDIELAEARLIATRRLDEVVKILKDKRNENRAMVIERLIKGIGYTERQANYICELRVIQIAAFSEEEQKNTIVKLKSRSKEIHRDLKDLDGVLIRRLKEMKAKYADVTDPNGVKLGDRKTKVESVQATKLRMKVKQKWVMVSRDIAFRTFEEVPLKKGDWPKRKSAMPEDTFITHGGETATIVLTSGRAVEVPIGYTKDGFIPIKEVGDDTVAGVITEQATIMAIVSEKGEVCAFENPVGRADYQGGKVSGAVKAALSLNKEDKFLLVSESGTAYWDYAKSLDLKRANTKGKHLGGFKTIVHAVAVAKDHLLYDEHGQPFEPFKKANAGETFDVKKPKRIFIVGKGSNLMLDTEGIPYEVTKQELVTQLRSKNVIRCWPLE